METEEEADSFTSHFTYPGRRGRLHTNAELRFTSAAGREVGMLNRSKPAWRRTMLRRDAAQDASCLTSLNLFVGCVSFPAILGPVVVRPFARRPCRYCQGPGLASR